MDTPDGWEDHPYINAFNDASFAIALAPLQEVIGLPIDLDQDADFYYASIAFIFDGNPKWLGIKLRDGYGQYMMDDFVSILAYGFAGSSAAAPFSSAGWANVIEMPTYLKKGSQFLIDLKNMSDTTSIIFNQPFELRGFKRYPAAEVCVG